MNALALILATVEPQSLGNNPVDLATKALGRPTNARLGHQDYKLWQTPYYQLEIEPDGNNFIVYAPIAFNTHLTNTRLLLTPGAGDYEEDVEDLHKVLAALVKLKRDHKRIIKAIFDASYPQAALLFKEITGVRTDALTMEQTLANPERRAALKALL